MRISKKTVEESMIAQLTVKGAATPVFIDLVKDYMKLWATKEKLAADIEERGVVYKDVSSVGVEMMKNNTSVKELIGVNRQMLSILERLNITTDFAPITEADDDGL